MTTTDFDTTRDELARLTLQIGVGRAMDNLAVCEGPSPATVEQARVHWQRITSDMHLSMDSMLYGGAPGAAAEGMALLIETLAILAWQPGGVTFAGLHWDAGQPDTQGQVCCTGRGVPWRSNPS